MVILLKVSPHSLSVAFYSVDQKSYSYLHIPEEKRRVQNEIFMNDTLNYE